MNTDRKSNIVVVLDRPQDAVNVGAVVRAVKNMGFTQLRLVNPRPFVESELAGVAHHAEDVIGAIRVHTTLDQALADAVYVVGTAAIAHAERRTRRDIEPFSRELLEKAAVGPVVLLFGTEDDGLDSAALDRCHAIAALPTNPAYPALNLAQSVLLFLYELARQATAATAAEQAIALAPELPQPPGAQGVPQAQLERMFTLWEDALAAMGFFRYNPQVAMRTLRQLAYRAELQPQEAALLMAVARQTLYAVKHREDPTGTAGARTSGHK